MKTDGPGLRSRSTRFRSESPGFDDWEDSGDDEGLGVLGPTGSLLVRPAISYLQYFSE